jgi:hypothetical protein
MDSVALALSISIAVVLVLLLSCWNNKPCNKKRNRSNFTAHNNVDLSDEVSATGRGVVETKAKERYADLAANLSSYDDYNQVAQQMSLEPEVFDSHSAYSKDSNMFSLGPSNMAERSDPNDVISFVGLRRPDYGGVPISSTARTEHSEMVDQMQPQRAYTIGI